MFTAILYAELIHKQRISYSLGKGQGMQMSSVVNSQYETSWNVIIKKEYKD